jgi:hypothetical protein
MSAGQRPANERTSGFFDDYITTSGGVLASDDPYSYQAYGTFDEPSTQSRTFWFAYKGEHDESTHYKCFDVTEDSDYVLTASEFIDKVIGKTADALFLNSAGDKLVIQQLERNKVVPLYWLDDDKVEQLKSLSEDMYNQYMNDGYVLVNTSCVQQEKFGYVLKHTNTVRIANGVSMPNDVFKRHVQDETLVEVERFIMNRVFIQDDTRRPYLFSDQVIHGYIDQAVEGYIPTDACYSYSERDEVYFLDNETAISNGYAYCENRGDWVPKDEVREQPNCGYHSGERLIFKCDRDNVKFMVGFEIEKEDYDAYEIGWQKVFDRTQWLKENDGSLCDETGYELITPVYDLFSNKLDKDLLNDRDLVRLVDAGYGESCGGHINISSTIYSPVQLFNGIKAFIPLLYSMYNFRLDGEYCAPKKHSRLEIEHEKYSSVHFKGDRNLCRKDSCMEIRIVSAVRSVKNLLWRRDLIRLMMDNINRSEREVLSMLLNDRSRLHKHMRKTYSEQTLRVKCNEYVQFAEEYNNIKLPKINWAEVDARRELRKSNKQSNDNTDSNNLSA